MSCVPTSAPMEAGALFARARVDFSTYERMTGLIHDGAFDLKAWEVFLQLLQVQLRANYVSMVLLPDLLGPGLPILFAGQAQPDMRKQLDAARKDFADGLTFLQASAVSTASIRNELELAKGQWVFFDQALQKPPGTESLQTIATTSERVYEVMDNLTSLYDSAVRELFA